MYSRLCLTEISCNPNVAVQTPMSWFSTASVNIVTPLSASGWWRYCQYVLELNKTRGSIQTCYHRAEEFEHNVWQCEMCGRCLWPQTISDSCQPAVFVQTTFMRCTCGKCWICPVTAAVSARCFSGTQSKRCTIYRSEEKSQPPWCSVVHLDK